MISAALAVLESEEQRNELAIFYEQNKNRFYAIAFEHLHNNEEAEDAVQEAFFHIAHNPDKFFSLTDENQLYYMSAVVRNISVDMYNRKNKVQIVDITEDTVLLSDCDLIENTMFDKASHTETLSFINSLPPLQRDVLVLNCLYDMSIVETAQALNISKTAVNQRLYLARKSIKRFLLERSK